MRPRGLVILALAAGIGYWIYKTRPTVAGFVDSVTRPVMGSRSAVKESETKRVLSDAAPAATDGEQISTTMIKEGMRKTEVEEMIGKPDSIQQITEDGHVRFRCVYVTARRILTYEEGRVVKIAVSVE
jgi:hypothetical protein